MQLYTDNKNILIDNETGFKKLGKAPAKPSPKLLSLSTFLKPKAEIVLPRRTSFWTKRKAFPLRTYGNTVYGDCTRASQAALATRMERIEQHRTIEITDEEVIEVYFRMSNRLYDGGDGGAYEIDALNEWRKPDLTFRDTKGRPHTIDAFLAVNYRNIAEIKKALYLAGAHGIKMCFNLPEAWSDNYHWDIAQGQLPTGKWEPGSWGGHSTSAYEYDDDKGVLIGHTWGVPMAWVSWRGVLQYADEAYVCLDSVNAWKKRVGKHIDISKLISEVNNVSSQKIK